MISLSQLQQPGDDGIVTWQAIPMKNMGYSWRTSQHIHPPSQICTPLSSSSSPFQQHKHPPTPASSLLDSPSPWHDWHCPLLEWGLRGRGVGNITTQYTKPKSWGSQAWDPNFWGGKTNTKCIPESMILEGGTWVEGGEIQGPPLSVWNPATRPHTKSHNQYVGSMTVLINEHSNYTSSFIIRACSQ